MKVCRAAIWGGQVRWMRHASEDLKSTAAGVADLDAIRWAHEGQEGRIENHLNDQTVIEVLAAVQENVTSLVDRRNQMADELAGLECQSDCHEKDTKDRLTEMECHYDDSGEGLQRMVRSHVEDVAGLVAQKHDEERSLSWQFAELPDELLSGRSWSLQQQ
jgi:hypothetical protein